MNGSSSRPRSRRAAPGTPDGDGNSGFASQRVATFTRELRPYRDALRVSVGDAGRIPSSDLLRPEALRDVVAPMLARHPEADERAVISLWFQWYFARLIIPATALIVRARRVLPLGLDEVEMGVDEASGRPREFVLAHPGRVRPEADPFERFRTLVRGHLDPLIEALGEHTGLSRNLLWSNVGTYLDWVFSLLVSRSEDGEAEDVRSKILEARHWPDGWRNRLRGTVRVVRKGDERVRQRRVCCIRYLIPGMDGCGDLCPLKKS